MEDTKVIRFSNMTKFVFNEDQTIIFNRLNGQWVKVPKQCYDILELCNKEGCRGAPCLKVLLMTRIENI